MNKRARPEAPRGAASPQPPAALFVEPEVERPGVVELNVGGRVYVFSRATLNGAPAGALFTMFAETSRFAMANIVRDREDRPFIDRDPDAFAVVAALLRTGQPLVPPNVSLQRAQCELDYFFERPARAVTEGMAALARNPLGYGLAAICRALRASLLVILRDEAMNAPSNTGYLHVTKRINISSDAGEGNNILGSGNILLDVDIGLYDHGNVQKQHTVVTLLLCDCQMSALKRTLDMHTAACIRSPQTTQYITLLNALASQSRASFRCTIAELCEYVTYEAAATSAHVVLRPFTHSCVGIMGEKEHNNYTSALFTIVFQSDDMAALLFSAGDGAPPMPANVT